jgi:hypothetical protein
MSKVGPGGSAPKQIKRKIEDIDIDIQWKTIIHV